MTETNDEGKTGIIISSFGTMNYMNYTNLSDFSPTGRGYRMCGISEIRAIRGFL